MRQCKENVLLVTQSYKNIHYFEIQNSYHHSFSFPALCEEKQRLHSQTSHKPCTLSSQQGNEHLKTSLQRQCSVVAGRVTQVTCLPLIMSFMPGWLKSLRKSCFKGHHHWFLSAAAEVNELVLSWFLPTNIDVKTLVDSSTREDRAVLLEMSSAALQFAAPEKKAMTVHDVLWRLKYWYFKECLISSDRS